MSQPKSGNVRRTTSPKLNFEALESRQLMAADLNLAPIPEPILGPSHPITIAARPSDSSQATMTQGRTTRTVEPIPQTAALARTFDGLGNNLINPQWGSAGQQLLRAAAADYADGISELAGADRPSAREISNSLSAQPEDASGNERGVSAFAYVWGQFLDHDLGLSSSSTDALDASNINVPTGDEWFDPNGTGTQTISFHRSLFDETTGDSVDNPRQQLNALTSFIDGSMIYGADEATASSLRNFEGGKLLIGDDGLPPIDEHGFFITGDVRANENIELTSMHTLFLREHNYWAEKIAAQDPSLNDEAIFQQARAIVIGEIQAITYNEFLPSLLGKDALSRYAGYDPTVNPGIANEFSTAAYRLHTLINDDVEFFGNNGRAIRDEVALKEAFFNPDMLRETGIDSILKYVASSQSQEFDTRLVDSLRNFLFGEPGQGGFDLAALNIQRGRDHGLADYNTTREAYGLDRVNSIADITSDPELQQALEELYGGVDDIDLWVGLLAEDHLRGSSAGETTQAILVDQFERIRNGDRFWYQNIFQGESLRQLESTSLADVIQRNSNVRNLQKNVFFMRAEIRGQVFADNNASTIRDRNEQGLAGITVQLLNDQGEVIDTVVTNRNGRYTFDSIHETGDYQVRVLLKNRLQPTTSLTRDVLISRGDRTAGNINFGLRSSTVVSARRTRGIADASPTQTSARDLAFSGIDLLNDLESTINRRR